MIGAGVVRCGGDPESSLRGLRNGPTGAGRVVFPPDPEVGVASGECVENGGRLAGEQVPDLVAADLWELSRVRGGGQRKTWSTSSTSRFATMRRCS